MAQSDSPQGKGTRAVMGSWLSTVKHMTYTKYSHLPTTEKLAIQEEYGKRGRKEVRVPGQVNQAQEGEAPAVSKV
jgi:hypothetical protein